MDASGDHLEERFTLILTALVDYKSREMNWENKALDYPEDIRIDFTFTIVVIVFIFTSLAFIIPSVINQINCNLR